MKSNFIKYNFIQKGDQGFKETGFQYAQRDINVNNTIQMKSSCNHRTTFCQNSENDTKHLLMKCNGHKIVRQVSYHAQYVTFWSVSDVGWYEVMIWVSSIWKHQTSYPGIGCHLNIMTSWNENIFDITGPFYREFTGHWWIPLTKASDAELWCFLWSAPKQTVELTIQMPMSRHHRAHFDVIAMPTMEWWKVIQLIAGT